MSNSCCLIGAQFQGVGARINLVPQGWQLNRGANSPWRAMEQEWGEAIIDGRKVVVDMDVIYPPSAGSRPESFVVRWTVGGVEAGDRSFLNQAGA
ncbi:DNA/RNA non-specific endonuclease [Teredinibacter turnerae]|uniref:DNA/RNA non-specific endonuclease n=1 Tax=Teredinibacter turnerae TaxID=2426 RepID=UPI0030CA68E9